MEQSIFNNVSKFTNTSWIVGFNNSNMDYFSAGYIPYYGPDYGYTLPGEILNWMNWISIALGLPLAIIVIIAVFFQVKKGQDPPVYVINLLVSDLIQLCCRIPLDFNGTGGPNSISLIITCCGIIVSVGFMMCISCERYLVIAKPLWYRLRRNIKTYVVVCIVVWILPLFFLLLGLSSSDLRVVFIIFIVFLLLPVPLFIFFLVGTIKALSGALSVPADEKRRIAAIQVVVLIIYTLLYLPIIIWLQYEKKNYEEKYASPHNPALPAIALVCIFLSPLADTTLYLFSRKSIMDKFLAFICSCEISKNQETSSTDHESKTVTNTDIA